jgi:hypothetical protein
MVLAAKSQVGVAIALLVSLGVFTFGPVPAYAATIAPTVTITGQLIQLADQTGPAVAAVRTADNQLVPVEATAVRKLKPGAPVTLNVVVPAAVRSVAAANHTLTVRGPNGRRTSTPLDTRDLAAASDGTPEPATSDLGRATVASAVSTGQALAVSAVVSAADPVGSFTPATRHLFVAIVTPKDWPTPNAVTSAQVQTQVAGASSYWSTVSGGAVTLDLASITPPRYTSAFNCGDGPVSMFNEAISQTGFKGDANTSLVVELPAGISKDLTSSCGYGLGSIGANVNDAGMLYVSDDVFPVLAHELGHNMSLRHADTLQCPAASDSAFDGTSWTGSGCTETSYGDGADVMSASLPSFAPFLSSPQSLRSGLIPAAAAIVISSDGTTNVTLNALGGRQGVRAAEVVDPSNGVTYYVEYRTVTAPDTANIRGDALGVRVLRFNPNPDTQVGGMTVLLDPTPTAAVPRDTDATLHVGSTFTSYSGATQVTTISTTPTTATIKITRGIIAPPAPTGSQVQRYVTRVYFDLFNRVPDPAGLAGWTSALNRGTPRVAVANAITSSAEYRSKLIAGSYDRYLSRTPDPGGLAGWLTAMGRGITIAQMESGFIASPEYYAKAGSTYAGWVTKLYADVLGRPASSSEVAGWTAQLRSGVRRDKVAIGFLLSTERLTTVVNGYYLDLLGRGIDPSGQRTWVGILQRGGRDEAIIGGIIASAEYYGRV